MSTCLKTTDQLYTQITESTDCSSSSCPPSASSEDFVPEGYLILTFDKAKRAKLKTAIFADVSDCRFADDFDDEDDNPPEEESQAETDRTWSEPQPARNKTPDTVQSDSASHTTGTNTATTLALTACYGGAVWVGENATPVTAGSEPREGKTESETGTSQHSLIRTSPIASASPSPIVGPPPLSIEELSTKRTIVIHRHPTLLLDNDSASSSTGTCSGSDENTPTPQSHTFPFRTANRWFTPNSVKSGGRIFPTATTFSPGSLYSRSRFQAESLRPVDFRHAHGRHCGKMLRCEACGKYYRNEYSLDHHICLKRKDVWKKGDVPSKIIDGQVIYFCPSCHKPFKWLGNLTRHYYVHTGQRFFKCDICPKEFFSAYQVKRHMNSHTGVRFKCEVCEKPFTCKYACAWHTRQHYTYVE